MSKTSRRVKMVVAVLLGAAVVGAIGYGSNGFKDWNGDAWKENFVPKHEVKVSKVSFTDTFNHKETTIKKEKEGDGRYIISGKIAFNSVASEEYGVGNYVELKIHLANIDETKASVQITNGEDLVTYTAEDEWLIVEGSVLKTKTFTYLFEAVEGAEHLFLFDNDGDFGSEEDQSILEIALSADVELLGEVVEE